MVKSGRASIDAYECNRVQVSTMRKEFENCRNRLIWADDAVCTGM